MASKAKRLLSQIKKSKTLTEPPTQNSFRMSTPITSAETTTSSNIPPEQTDTNQEDELDPLSFLSKYSIEAKPEGSDYGLNLNTDSKLTQNKEEPAVPKHSFTSKNVANNFYKQNEFTINTTQSALGRHNNVSPNPSGDNNVNEECKRKQQTANGNEVRAPMQLLSASNKTVNRCKKYMKCYKDKVVQNKERVEKLNKLTKLIEDKCKGKKTNIEKVERIMNELVNMKIEYVKDKDVQKVEVIDNGKGVKRKLDIIEIEMLMS